MSRPGLSMWGKEGEPMTPQERAAQLYGSLTCTTYREGYQDPDNDIALIADVLQQTRRAALLEAAKLVGDYNCMHDHGKMATKACDDVFDELHRLAQEG